MSTSVWLALMVAGWALLAGHWTAGGGGSPGLAIGATCVFATALYGVSRR